MKIYEWILFDADETLFHFDAFSGLQRMFVRFDIQFTEQDYEVYESVNKPLWLDYQDGLITASQLQHRRFETWAAKLRVSTETLNNAFLDAMADICAPIDGAIQLIATLKDKAKLGIITNGFTKLQHIRLDRMGLRDHFKILVTSEEVGIAKPHSDIFNHALSCMSQPPRERVLMVGDNLDTDIIGGINAGLDTCWLNMHNKAIPNGIKPTFQVSSLIELNNLLASEALSVS